MTHGWVLSVSSVSHCAQIMWQTHSGMVASTTAWQQRWGLLGLLILIEGDLVPEDKYSVLLYSYMLCSDPTPTFSATALSTYTPSYEAPDTWNCITVVSEFPDTIPTHPLDILPHIAPEPVTPHSLMCSWPYTTHRFTEFRPRHTDGDPSELRLAPQGHFTHTHTLEHSTFCQEHVCLTHFPYGGNKLAK
jgi:hypothetical protein